MTVEERTVGMWLPAEATSMLLRSRQGVADPTLYRLRHAGAWNNTGVSDERSGVYYEDEERPPGAASLYLLDQFVPTKDGSAEVWLPAQPLGFQDETLDSPPRLRRLRRAIIGAVDGWRGQRRDWRSSSSW